MSQRSEKLIAELGALEDPQERIDLVAEDLFDGKKRFASIDAWELGELLGLDVDTLTGPNDTLWALQGSAHRAQGYENPQTVLFPNTNPAAMPDDTHFLSVDNDESTGM